MLSYPAVYGLFRLRAQGQEDLPRDQGFVLAANHTSNFDPWPLGLPLWPRRQLRFMAKSELFNPLLTPFLRAAGAFKVRRGEGDVEAMRTAIDLVRSGEVVVMFPEGTRRKKGLRKKYAARPHTGAARIALGADAPLVPAAIIGTDRLSRLGPLRVVYGEPLDLSDLDGLDHKTAAEAATERLMARIEELRAAPLKPLLVVDGDSFAHRAYHAMPKTVRLGCVVGFSNMVLRLWQAEQPRAVLVGWDSLGEPTYRNEAFEAYQGGREFDEALLEQLDMLPKLVTALGFAYAKAPGYEADDFLAAAVAFEEARGGEALVATSDRDAFQLASDRTTILQPVRGVSELARIGPVEVRERYAVEPEQVPDFIALRGDPSDKLPGASGVGPKKAADVLREHGTLEAALAAGRFSAEADDLRLYLRIATLDPTAPLPPLEDQTPTWAEASELARGWGLNQLADRLAGMVA